MSDPAITTLFPSRAIPGGRVTFRGEHLLSPADWPPEVRLGDQPARVVVASPRTLVVVVPEGVSGRVPVSIAGVETRWTLLVAAPLATGLHQVDSPACDADGRVYVTYSGSRGQDVPVSLFRVSRGGAREPFSDAVDHPTGLAVDAQGLLYVSDRFAGTVSAVSADGSADVVASDLGAPCGLAFGPDGVLYVGDRSGTIVAVTPGGPTRTLATLPPSVAAFHLAADADGLFVTAPTVASRDVVYHVAWDGTTRVVAEGLGRPQGVLVDVDGAALVADALAGAGGVYRVRDGEAPALVVAGGGIIGLARCPGRGLLVATAETVFAFDDADGAPVGPALRKAPDAEDARQVQSRGHAAPPRP